MCTHPTLKEARDDLRQSHCEPRIRSRRNPLPEEDFTLEKLDRPVDLSTIGRIKRSVEMVLGHAASAHVG